MNAKKYGLNPILFNQTDTLKQSNQADYEKWFKNEADKINKGGDIFYKNYLGAFFRLNKDKLLKKFVDYDPKENRWGIARLVNDMLSTPNEVWIQKDGTDLRVCYIKIYEHGNYATICHFENELEVITWYKIKEESLGNIRTGLLIKKGD